MSDQNALQKENKQLKAEIAKLKKTLAEKDQRIQELTLDLQKGEIKYPKLEALKALFNRTRS